MLGGTWGADAMMAKGVCACQVILILLAAVVANLAFSKLVADTEMTWMFKKQCTGDKYACYELTPAFREEFNVSTATSHENKVCMTHANGKLSKGRSEIAVEHTCAPELHPCQIWYLKRGKASLNFDSGLSGSFEKGQPTIVTERRIGRKKREVDERCGLNEKGLPDTKWVHLDGNRTDTNDGTPDKFQLFRFAPTVWVFYKLIGLDVQTMDRLFSRLARCRVRGSMGLLMSFVPYFPQFSSIATPVVHYLKFSIMPFFMLAMLMTMETVDCKGDPVCERNTEHVLISHDAEILIPQLMWMWCLWHSFILAFTFAFTSCFCTGMIVEDEQEGKARFEYAEINVCGKLLLAALAFCDLGIIALTLIGAFNVVAVSSMSIGLALSASFKFDLKANRFIDVFQLLALLLLAIETLTRAAKGFKIVHSVVKSFREG